MSNFLIQTNIPWPRPGFHGLSSVSSSREVLQREDSIPAKSRLPIPSRSRDGEGGPLFHLAYMKHVPLMRLRRIKNAVISISYRNSKTFNYIEFSALTN